MKKRCYPKYTYIICFIGSCMPFALLFFPLFIFVDEKSIYNIIYPLLMVFSTIAMLIVGIICMQYYIIDDKYIKVICFGKVIEKIKLSDCIYEVSTLPIHDEKWICTYDKKFQIKKFTSGCANKKNSHKIQILYSEYALNKLIENNVEQIKQTVEY